MTTLYKRTTVLVGNRIELTVPELPEGSTARVIVIPEGKKKKLSEILGNYSGGQFNSGEEVDEYLHRERDSWDK